MQCRKYGSFDSHRPHTPNQMEKFEVAIRAWDEPVARCYGEFCSALEAQGISLGDSDMMIAAHAVTVNATLVNRDRAFSHEPARLRLEVW